MVAEFFRRARETRRTVHEATALVFAADIADARNDRQAALATLQQAIDLGETAGLPRVLAAVYARAAEIHRESGDLEKAGRSAELAAASVQAIYPRINKGTYRSAKRSQIRPDQLGVRLHLPKDARQGSE